ncbi:MAG TPA: MFS transporter, partial [Acidimicrobiales bacterium]|nr:MFS transporter [Acidimicrobiales bacterium]
VVLDATIVNVAMPSIERSIGFSPVDRQWLVTAYSLSFGSVLFLGGRLSDVIGRKTTLQIGLLGFALASALGGAAQNFGMLVTARAIQGTFGAVLAPAALAMVTTTFTDRAERGKAFGIYGSIAGAGAGIGLLLGGVLTTYLDWRWTMYVNLIFAGIAVLGTQVLLPRERGTAKRGLDLVSTLLISSGLFAIVYGLSDAATNATNAQTSLTPISLASAFGTTTTVVCLVLGVVLVGLFVRRQARIERPMLPLAIVTDRARGGSLLAIFLAASSMFAVFLFLTFFLQYVKGYSAMGAGLAFLPMVVVLSVVAASASTILLPRVGPRALTPVGMAIGAVGMWTFTRLQPDASYLSHVLPGLLITGVAMGLVFATSMNTATTGVPPEFAGSASASVNVTQQVGGSIGTALLSTVSIAALVASTQSFLRAAAAAHAHVSPADLAVARNLAQVHGYTRAFWWGTIIFAIGAIATAVILPSNVRPAASHAVPDAEPEPELVSV